MEPCGTPLSYRATGDVCEHHHHHVLRCNSFSPGDYEVSIKFNDEHIPDSPFIVPIATLSDDARRLTITSLQVRSSTVREPAEATDT